VIEILQELGRQSADRFAQLADGVDLSEEEATQIVQGMVTRWAMALAVNLPPDCLPPLISIAVDAYGDRLKALAAGQVVAPSPPSSDRTN